MRKYWIYILLLMALSSCDVTKIIIDRHINRDFVLVDSLYWCKYEVTNKEYNLFLKELKQHNAEEYEKCKRNNEKWYEEMGSNRANVMIGIYDSHPAYENYPVVTISYYGAQKYCEWLSDRNGDGITFRLPTKREFKTLMKTVNVNYEQEVEQLCDTIRANLIYEVDKYGLGKFTYQTRQKKYKSNLEMLIQNEYNMYNIIGNVSELVQEKGSMGGSWNSYPHEAEQFLEYNGPSVTIGFRVVYDKYGLDMN